MSTAAGPKVETIVKALSGLEDDLDSLAVRLAEMKKSLGVKAQKEIENMMARTREIATTEAEEIISAARTSAESESSRITEDGEARLQKVRSRIDEGFDDAVNHVVYTVMGTQT